MKKSIFVLGLIISNFLIAQSQNAGAVIYQFRHLRDTLANNFYEEEMILYFSTSLTSYKSYTGLKQDSIIKSQVEKNLQTGGRMQLGSMKATTRQNYYRDLNIEKAFVESKIGEDIFLYEDTMRPIKWQLLNREKSIGGFQCKAAKANYFGRTYIVWYSPEIPINGGHGNFMACPA